MRLNLALTVALFSTGLPTIASITYENVDNQDSEMRLFSKNSSFFSNIANFVDKNIFGKFKDSSDIQSETKENFLNLNDINSVFQESFNNVPTLSSSASYASNQKQENSPALSALALLGFLYFLHFIEDVLTGTNGRRKRELEDELTMDEAVNTYLTSLEGILQAISEYIPEEGVKDLKAENSNRTPDGRSLEDRANDAVNILNKLFVKLSDVFGFNQEGTSRNDEITEEEFNTATSGFWSVFGSRIGLMATIMDFLKDPRPSRIGRSQRTAEYLEREDLGNEEEIAIPIELTAEEKSFLPSSYFDEEGKDIEDQEERDEGYLEMVVPSRKKRFTDGMNSWYSTAARPGSTTSNSGSQMLGLVFNILRGVLTNNS